MDRRQKKTRDAIFTAFSELLSQKSYSKITVQDIIDAANVGRTTFYAHFETKDDLLREMCTDIFDHVISDSLKIEGSHDFSLGKGAPMEIVTHILYHLRDNRKNIIGVLSCESGELFMSYFKGYFRDLLETWLQDEAGIPQVPRDFLLNHITGSFVNMIQWWIKHNLAQSPEDLTGYFEAVIGPLLLTTSRESPKA